MSRVDFRWDSSTVIWSKKEWCERNNRDFVSRSSVLKISIGLVLERLSREIWTCVSVDSSRIG